MSVPLRYHAPYLEWAKTRAAARLDLAGSNVLACTLADLEGAREALDFAGRNDNGYAPLVEAIAERYGVDPGQVTTAQGTSGANFLVYAALLEPGDEVLIERPGYDPLLGAPGLLDVKVRRFDRRFAEDWRADVERIQRQLTDRTRLIVITRPHNPSGAAVDAAVLREIGELAASRGAHVLVDEVYLDVTDAQPGLKPRATAAAATLGPVFITTNSLTKSYGLSALRSGWILSSADIAYRVQRARDVVDGTGSIVTERLSVLALRQLDRLLARSQRLLLANRTLVNEFLRGRTEVEWTEPAGGTVVFPRIRGVGDASTFVSRLLQERETAVVPGSFFEAPAHFRIGFGGATDTLRAGLAQIGAALDARAW